MNLVLVNSLYYKKNEKNVEKDLTGKPIKTKMVDVLSKGETRLTLNTF